MFALKKNENTVSFTVRLNLNRAEHARAYELLKNSPHSRTATIVDALTAEAPAPGGIADAEALKEIVHQAVSDADGAAFRNGSGRHRQQGDLGSEFRYRR